MTFSLQQIAAACQGKLSGKAGQTITGVAPYDKAGDGELVFLLEEKFLKQKTNASAVVIKKGLPVDAPAIIQVDDPRLAMAKVLALFKQPLSLNQGIHQTAIIGKGSKVKSGAQIGPYVVIGENVKVGKNVKLYAGVFIGDRVEIGEETCIFSNVSIYHDVKIGKKTRLHAGAVIGADGYGFAPGKTGYTKIPQVGGVIIEDQVEIYANTCIARGTIGNTIIKKGTKIDNLTHIAHNCKLGRHCAITGLVGFAGSVTLEDHVTVGGQAGFSGHLTVGENTVVTGKAGVTKNIPKNSIISGFPAGSHAKDLQRQALINRLPRLYQKVKALEKRIAELEQK